MTFYVILTLWAGFQIQISSACIRFALGPIVIGATAADLEMAVVQSQMEIGALHVEKTALAYVLKTKLPEEYEKFYAGIKES